MKYPFKGKYQITCNFSCHKKAGGIAKRYAGTDWGMSVGTKLYAIEDGWIRTYTSAGAKVMELYNDTYKWQYAHLSKYIAKPSRVKEGDLIALSGNTGITTGPHLHLGCIKNGKRIDPNKELKSNIDDTMGIIIEIDKDCTLRNKPSSSGKIGELKKGTLACLMERSGSYRLLMGADFCGYTHKGNIKEVKSDYITNRDAQSYSEATKSYSDRMGELDKEVKELNAQLAALKRVNGELSEENALLKKESDGLKKELSACKVHIKELEEKMVHKSKLIGDLRKEIDCLEKQLDICKNKPFNLINAILDLVKGK